MLILTFNFSLASDDLCDAALGRRVNSPQGPVKGLFQEIFGEIFGTLDIEYVQALSATELTYSKFVHSLVEMFSKKTSFLFISLVNI